MVPTLPVTGGTTIAAVLYCDNRIRNLVEKSSAANRTDPVLEEQTTKPSVSKEPARNELQVRRFGQLSPVTLGVDFGDIATSQLHAIPDRIKTMKSE